IQATHQPHDVLEQLLRIGRRAIVSFPNFGHGRIRWHVMFRGRMPVTQNLTYAWYDTPNIHLCTVADFEVLCDSLGIEIMQRAVVDNAHRSGLGLRLLPHLLGEICLYRLRRR
ncbi:MAG: methionine biosynthesis protein MetW, partial [Gammaproteobacteria bacterium]